MAPCICQGKCFLVSSARPNLGEGASRATEASKSSQSGGSGRGIQLPTDGFFLPRGDEVRSPAETSCGWGF